MGYTGSGSGVAAVTWGSGHVRLQDVSSLTAARAKEQGHTHDCKPISLYAARLGENKFPPAAWGSGGGGWGSGGGVAAVG